MMKQKNSNSSVYINQFMKHFSNGPEKWYNPVNYCKFLFLTKHGLFIVLKARDNIDAQYKLIKPFP